MYGHVLLWRIYLGLAFAPTLFIIIVYYLYRRYTFDFHKHVDKAVKKKRALVHFSSKHDNKVNYVRTEPPSMVGKDVLSKAPNEKYDVVGRGRGRGVSSASSSSGGSSDGSDGGKDDSSRSRAHTENNSDDGIHGKEGEEEEEAIFKSSILDDSASSSESDDDVFEHINPDTDRRLVKSRGAGRGQGVAKSKGRGKAGAARGSSRRKKGLSDDEEDEEEEEEEEKEEVEHTEVVIEGFDYVNTVTSNL